MNEFDIVNVIKRASSEARNASKPSDVMFGTVISTSPIKIQVSQKLTLSAMQLVIPHGLSKYTVSMTDESNIEKQVTVDNSLKNGDKVILIRQEGGQKYFVMDKVVDA